MKGTPEPPESLSFAAQELWRAYAVEYEIEIPDIPLWSIACESLARWQFLSAKANELGPLVTIKGEVCVNPYLTRADKEQQNFARAMTQILKNQQGRGDGEEETDEDGPDPAAEFAKLQELLIARLGPPGEDARRIEGDCATDRPPVGTAAAKNAATKKATVQVRNKANPGSRPAKGKQPRKT